MTVKPPRGARPTVRSFHLARGARAAAIAVACVTCGPIVEQAPFPARPDVLAPGDLLGPFDGFVLDAETERPISGAVVGASWAFERGLGFSGPAGAHDVATESDADGRFRVPRLRDLPGGGSTRVRRFTLVVYRRGYVGWRSDVVFPDGVVRRDFGQRATRVRLKRWRDDLSHARHLVFLGGSPAIRRAASWEIQLAGLELDGVKRPAAAGEEAAAFARVLDVAALLSEDEVRAVTGYAGAFDVVALPDLPATDFYGSRHFRAREGGERFDVGLRVWRLGEGGAEEEYRRRVAELASAVSSTEIGDEAVRARGADAAGLVFLSRRHGVVVSLTCGLSQCTEPATLTKLGKLVEGRLPDLGTVPAPAGLDGAAPSGGAP